MAILDYSERLISRRFRVNGPSMEPTFPDGTAIRLTPLSLLWRNPRRSEVIGLLSPENKERFELKRIVGLPGESVSWQGGVIWINGFRLPEFYVSHEAISGEEKNWLELGPGEYFVAGDNRSSSRDSRHFGPVWRSDILGLAIASNLELSFS